MEGVRWTKEASWPSVGPNGLCKAQEEDTPSQQRPNIRMEKVAE